MSTSSNSLPENEAATSVGSLEGSTPSEGTQPVTFAVIPVDNLKPHPKHVRGDLKLTRKMLASVAASGVEEALDVVPIIEVPASSGSSRDAGITPGN